MKCLKKDRCYIMENERIRKEKKEPKIAIKKTFSMIEKYRKWFLEVRLW